MVGALLYTWLYVSKNMLKMLYLIEKKLLKNSGEFLRHI